MTDHATTGDGILTGLHLLAEMARTGKSLAELAAVMTVCPQVLVNVHGCRRTTGATATRRSPPRSGWPRAELGDDGRVLLRPSGTEPLVRVMVEASDRGLADEIAQTLADVVRKQLALYAPPTASDRSGRLSLRDPGF